MCHASNCDGTTCYVVHQKYLGSGASKNPPSPLTLPSAPHQLRKSVSGFTRNILKLFLSLGRNKLKFDV